MIQLNMKALVPEVRLVENVGNDAVASHEQLKTLRIGKHTKTGSINGEFNIDDEIESNIYNMRWRNFLAPIKSIIGF